MNKKKIIPIAAGVIILTFLFFAFSGGSSGSDGNIIVGVKKGEFIVDITTSGELEAKNSVKIKGPEGMRANGIWQVTIQDLIDEGTFVKKGEFVARLDASELTTKLNNVQIELDKAQSQYTQTQLDTTLQMRESRDELINLEYAIEEKQLTLDQSQFEPPATIKKAEIEVTKSKRAFSQAQENYFIKQRQNEAKMDEVSANLQKQKNNLQNLQTLVEKFTIIAPEDGMLIYHKNWNGVVKAGSQIGAWDPIVATLPDMSIMLSKTYVNEVDIRKIKSGQLVELGLDAFPEKKLTGKVIKVANVGEQRPNSDSKVFQVDIQLNESDEMIKPGMTTSNRIITKVNDESLFIPLECLNSQFDSITYVFLKDGLNIIKQEVIVGDVNSNEATILGGLNESDLVYLSKVPDKDDDSIELLPEMNGKRNNEEEISEPKPASKNNLVGSRG